MRFDAALEGYWLARRRDFTNDTVTDYTRTFDLFSEFNGARPVEEINPKHIEEYLTAQQKKFGWSNKTLRNSWIALSSFFTWAEVELKIDHPIRGKVKGPKVKRPQIRPYTRVEITSMLYEATHAAQWTTATGKKVRQKLPSARRNEAILLVLLDCGIRNGELCRLNIGDYYRRHQRLVIERGKGEKERDLYLGDRAAKALWRYLADRENVKDSNPLFASRTETRLRRDNLLNIIRAIAKKAGVPKPTVHRFRHTFAIEFLRNGGNVLELKRLLGHESMHTITIYVELASVDLENAIRRASPADNWKL